MADRSSARLPVMLVGVDHRSAEIELRERVSYEGESAEDLLVRLIAREEIEEALLISTCNRTEIYLRPVDEDKAFETALQTVFCARAPEIRSEGRFYVKHHHEAALHLLSVAAGLESMVLGEPEILGQVKQATQLADSIGTSGAFLRHLGRTALAAGRRARAETRIGTGPVSFGYAAVELANNIFTRLQDAQILVLGAGEMATSVSRSLIERGAASLSIANRSRNRAEEFRKEFPQARVIDYERRFEAIAEADVVISATSAPDTILGHDELEACLDDRRAGALLIVDLGVPRDVDPRAGELNDVFLHDIDSLQELIQRTLAQRRSHVPKVEEIVEQEVERFEIWYGSLAAGPLVARLHRQAEKIRADEVDARRGQFPPSSREDLDDLTRAIVRKLLHHPSTRLRESAGGEHIEQLAALRELFQLGEEPGE